VSADGEDRLVIDCSDYDSVSAGDVEKNVPLKSPQDNNVTDVCMTRSKARLLAKMSYVNESLCQKPAQSMGSESLCEDSPKTTDSSGLEKSLEAGTSLGYFGTAESTPCSDGTNRMSEDTVVPASGVSVRRQSECSAANAHERERQTGDVGLTAAGAGSNVSYKLWKLTKDKDHTNDSREVLLKGDHSNREVKVLVRCKVDGSEVNI
jgi:hypothetical protein